MGHQQHSDDEMTPTISSMSSSPSTISSTSANTSPHNNLNATAVTAALIAANKLIVSSSNEALHSHGDHANSLAHQSHTADLIGQAGTNSIVEVVTGLNDCISDSGNPIDDDNFIIFNILNKLTNNGNNVGANFSTSNTSSTISHNQNTSSKTNKPSSDYINNLISDSSSFINSPLASSNSNTSSNGKLVVSTTYATLQPAIHLSSSDNTNVNTSSSSKQSNLGCLIELKQEKFVDQFLSTTNPTTTISNGGVTNIPTSLTSTSSLLNRAASNSSPNSSSSNSSMSSSSLSPVLQNSVWDS
jgi:hypothetical protein